MTPSRHAAAPPHRPSSSESRTRRVGVFILVLALFTVASSIYFEKQARDARACIDEKVSSLVAAVEARGDLNTRSNAATKAVVDAVVKAQSEPPEVGQATFEDALDAYAAEVAAIEADRKKTPLPGYPPGECAE